MAVVPIYEVIVVIVIVIIIVIKEKYITPHCCKVSMYYYTFPQTPVSGFLKPNVKVDTVFMVFTLSYLACTLSMAALLIYTAFNAGAEPLR